MRKLILMATVFCASFLTSNAQSNEDIHNGLVIGVINYENKEIITIEDQLTMIVYKSSPISKGVVKTGENVSIICNEDLKRIEVLKEGVRERVFCHNKDWNKGKDHLLSIPESGKIYFSENTEVIDYENGTGILVENDVVELPASALSLTKKWTTGKNGYSEKAIPGVFVKEVHTTHNGNQYTMYICNGSTGDCAKSYASKE